MFGQDDNNQNQQDGNIVQPINAPSDDTTNTNNASDNTSQSNAATDDSLAQDITTSKSSDDIQAIMDSPSPDDSPQTDSTNTADEITDAVESLNETSNDDSSPDESASSETSTDNKPQISLNESASPSSDSTDEPDSELLELKRSALQELSPLVDQLDQTNEEKFKTTMMMIQATDDRSLLPKTLETAKAIEDEKVRAQALLDVVNEINYFTTKND